MKRSRIVVARDATAEPTDLCDVAARALAPIVRDDVEGLRAAIRAGRARLLAVEATEEDRKSLPTFFWPLRNGEVLVCTAPMLRGGRKGHAALVVDGEMLPAPRTDEATLDLVASRLVEVLLAEVI